jgi:hypothetical protein
MSFVSYKYWLNEKFTEKDSDPIDDMGIGIKPRIEELLVKLKTERHVIIDEFNPDLLCWAAYYDDFLIAKYLISKGAIFNTSKNEYENHNALCFAAVAGNIDMGIFLIKSGANLEDSKKYAAAHCNYTTKEGLKEIENKLLENRERINEVFTEDSDPIKDMGIGIYSHHNFDTQEEALEYMYKIAPYLLKIKDLRKIIFRGGEFHIIPKYYNILNNYYKEYVNAKSNKYDKNHPAKEFVDLIKEKNRRKNK